MVDIHLDIPEIKNKEKKDRPHFAILRESNIQHNFATSFRQFHYDAISNLHDCQLMSISDHINMIPRVFHEAQTSTLQKSICNRLRPWISSHTLNLIEISQEARQNSNCEEEKRLNHMIKQAVRKNKKH